jgi:hypothetical protein
MSSPKQELLALYEEFPFERHPLWRSVLKGELTIAQVIAAEVQHCIRTRAGQALRKDALASAQALSPQLFAMLLETYLEECTQSSSSASA